MADELNTSLNELLTTNFGLSPSGYTGSRGDAGYTGSSGAAASTGFTGSAGTGFTGSSGTSGGTGSTGFTGSSGSAGSTGFTGSTGVGFAGSQGSAGFTGSTGVGFAGSQGSAGFVGSAGTTGAVGFTGSAGSGGSGSGNSIYSRTAITATAGQTSFAVAYTVGFLEVYFNGVLLTATDYTATTGSTVVLALAAVAGDIVEFITYNAVPVLSVPVATFNSTTLTANLAVTAGYSAVSVGPITVADGVSVAIAPGQKWVIL